MSFGKFGTDREARIDYPRMRDYRLARTRQMMEKHGIDLMITWDAWDIRYISSAYVTTPTRWTEGQFAVLPRSGDPYVFAATSFSCYKMREEMPWLKDKVFPSPGIMGKMAETVADLKPYVDMVCNIMSENSIANGTVGLDCCTSEILWQEALKEKGIKVVDAKKAMFDARMIKNQDEIECVRMACSNAEAAFADIVDAIKPGATECELMGIGMKRLYQLGADETQEFVLATGPRTNPLHIDYTDRQVRPGELVVVDINGNCWQGYKSCYYRTFSCGKATQEQKDTYEECRAMMYAAMGAMKAGNTTLDVCEKMPTDPKYWGYDRWEDVFGFAVGHGIGISLHEAPFMSYPMSKANPVVLEEGMVLAIETWTGKRGGKFGVRLEENVAITKDGYDLLSVFPVDELMECWP